MEDIEIIDCHEHILSEKKLLDKFQMRHSTLLIKASNHSVIYESCDFNKFSFQKSSQQ
jgi:hypothetical protein